MKFLVGVLIFQLSGVTSLAAGTQTIQGEAYLTRCEQVMDLFSNKEKTIEEHFLEHATTPGQMAQLIRDYALVFNKNFSEALMLTINPSKVSLKPKQQLKQLISINTLPEPEFRQFVWKVLEQLVELKAGAKSDIAGQTAYAQAKNFIEALKKSPNRRVAEDIFSTITRDSIVTLARSKLEEVKNSSSAAIPVILALVVGISGCTHFEMTHQVYSDDPSPLIVGLLYGLGAGLFPIMPMFVREALWKSKIKEPSPIEFAFVNAFKTQEKWASTEALKFLEKEEGGMETEMLSVKDGCEKETCLLTPVQLAYLGHVDILQLEALHSGVKAALKAPAGQEEVVALEEVARAVKDDPKNYTKHMLLKMKINKFTAKMKNLLEAQQHAVDSMIEYSQTLSATHFKALAKRPYALNPNSEDEIIKHGILMGKIQSDLKTLENITIDSKAVDNKLNHSRQLLSTLSSLFNNLPENGDGWKEAAEEVLARLDELR